MSRRLRLAALELAALLCLAGPAARSGASAATAADEAKVHARWDFFFEENRVDLLIERLSGEHRAGTSATAFTGVRLVSVAGGTVLPGSTVVVEDGRIRAVGKDGEVTIPRGARVIEGAGRYLVPGLTDMHVHQLVSSSQHLLHLATGITTVRDMDGFPWTLAMRRRIAEGRLLGPSVYLTGPILNRSPMGFYAEVVGSPEAGREAVRRHQAAGYDFVKVHNDLPLPTYEAILDEAKRRGIDVVGHIPHQVRIAQAVAAGQRTLEHFKGYILDRNLTLTDEDYVAATRGADVWLCPTFYNYRGQLRGEEARRLVETAEEMRYVSRRTRKAWLALAASPLDDSTRMGQRVFPLSQKIFKDLLPLRPRFLAGTDCGGGYPFMVPGFALHEELRLLEENGLSPLEALRTATVNAAAAMRREKDFGEIEPGKRADLLLLREDPLAKVANLRAIDGVMARGIWLARTDLDRLLGELAAIYDRRPETVAPPTPQRIDELVASLRALHGRGWVFRDHDLDELAKLLEGAGRPAQAAAVRALETGGSSRPG